MIDQLTKTIEPVLTQGVVKPNYGTLALARQIAEAVNDDIQAHIAEKVEEKESELLDGLNTEDIDTAIKIIETAGYIGLSKWLRQITDYTFTGSMD